jgi:lanosterol synthase
MDPIPPELFILPTWLPFHPWKWWCHTRLTSLPMAYLYGVKAQIKENDFIKELRKEIFVEKFETIKWSKYRSYVNELDNYNPSSFIWKILVFLIKIYEYIYISWIRKFSLSYCWDYIKFEDESTNFICVGPVNKAWNMLCCIFNESSKDSEHLKKHLGNLSL